MSFTAKILWSMLAGMLLGAALSLWGGQMPALTGFLVDGVFDVIGSIFVALLQMMVVPLVLVSLVCGVLSLGDIKTLGRMGAKTLGLYLFTTAIALCIALSVAWIIDPGVGLDLVDTADYEGATPPALSEVLIGMFPTNPFQALADGQMLQIIFFSLLLGFALSLSGAAGKRLGTIFFDLNEVIMKMVLLIIRTAPIGVFALIAQTFATQGLEVFGSLVWYFLAVCIGLLVHLSLTYSALLLAVGLSPAMFFYKMWSVMTFAFSTSSSGATIPMTLSNAEKRLGAKNSVASFTVPLGATINMDGTAIMQGVATVFIANAYNIDLTVVDYLTVILTATLASIGTAAVPGAGIIMLTMVLVQIGLPISAIPIILGVDRLLDMLRTAVNVTGDSAVTCVVAKTESALDRAIFDDRNAVVSEESTLLAGSEHLHKS